MYLIFFNAYMFLNEKARLMKMNNEISDCEYKESVYYANVFNVLSFVLNLANIFVFVMQTKTLGT